LKEDDITYKKIKEYITSQTKWIYIYIYTYFFTHVYFNYFLIYSEKNGLISYILEIEIFV
jgi:hypothetical protein